MTENEFNEAKNLIDGLFGADGKTAEQIAAEVAAEKAKAAPPKDGLWYVEDTTNSDGHTISWYRLVAHGKTLLWISADNDLEATPEQIGGKLQAGASAHALTVWSGDRTKEAATKGFGVRVPHPDGSGTHIDGQTVRAYVIPRASRWIASFYGV
jgi:hypothetical protein